MTEPLRSLDIDCPRCFSPSKHPCTDDGKTKCAPHVERGRMARWAAMGIPVMPSEL